MEDEICGPNLCFSIYVPARVKNKEPHVWFNGAISPILTKSVNKLTNLDGQLLIE